MTAKVTNWSITHEIRNGEPVAFVRRWVKATDSAPKLERMPVAEYAHVRQDPKALEEFVIRRNGYDPKIQKLKQDIKIQHAFISPTLLAEYSEFLHTQIPNEKNARCLFSYLRKYVLAYFITDQKIRNPVDWKRTEIAWGSWLMRQKLTAGTLNQIINEANRFVMWLHRMRPTEVKPLKFEPINRATMKHYEAALVLDKGQRPSKYMPQADIDTIRARLVHQPWIFAAMNLAYCYGLRESEVLGLQLDDVKENHLSIERQLRALPAPDKPKYGPLKGRRARTIEHKFCTPEEAYEWIETLTAALCFPDTLSRRWREAMQSLGRAHWFHDLRHCFITNAFRVWPNHVDVQMAAGHQNITTTMRYLHDDKKHLASRAFKPKKKGAA